MKFINTFYSLSLKVLGPRFNYANKWNVFFLHNVKKIVLYKTSSLLIAQFFFTVVGFFCNDAKPNH